MIYRKEEAEEILTPKRLGLLFQGIHAGYHSLQSLPKDQLLNLTKRGKANYRRDQSIARIRELFIADFGFKVFGDHNPEGLITFSFDGKIWVRFKRIFGGHYTANHSTPQSRAFEQQKPDMIPGLDGDVTLTNAGYIEDPMRTKMIAAQLVCTLNKQLLWMFRGDADEIIGYENPQVPFEPAPTTKRRLRVKSDDKTHSDERRKQISNGGS